jgi:hypothetical protein
MPTTTYSLHLTTSLSPYDVLDTLFSTEQIEPIAGAGVLYTRGSVFLAHGRISEPELCKRFKQAFGVRPTVSVSFFPNGVSSVNTAMTRLIEAVLCWLETTDDDLLLIAGQDTLVLKRENGVLTLNRNHSFWTPPRLTLIPHPYKTA